MKEKTQEKMDIDDPSDVPISISSQLKTSEETVWQKMINKAITAIVSIRFSQVSSFDTEQAISSEASGFVVDAERGIILTNRHVACSGPFVGEAIWHDHEETDVTAIYRDPIHDFGFLRFDPRKIKYMKVTEIELAPELAKVGLDIRVVGNDAGEKLSILAGSISRLNRNIADYGDMNYNDFNTFYLQAAASASGGSSGSPVLNIEGKAVGLQAGGHTNAATDFFFPLDRVKTALEYIRHGKSVPRGTIQAQFYHRPFDEVRRLGLRAETEAAIRSFDPEEIGMLVVEVVLPEGPADGLLQDGDVLVTVNGQHITKFVPLEDIMDSHVEKTVEVVVERGGDPLTLQISVQDLHSITPDRYVQAGGAKFNNLSYQLARQFCVPVSGVYVCDASGVFLFRSGCSESGWIISSFNSKRTRNLEEFIEAYAACPDRERVPVVYYSIADVHNTRLSIVTVDRHWSPFRMAVRNDSAGVWDFTDLAPPPPPAAIKPVSADLPKFSSDKVAWELWHSVVVVDMYCPVRIEGFNKRRTSGMGLVFDAEKGLVVVSRTIVPFTLGDVTVTIAESIVIPATIEYLHPTQNIAVVRYDPSLIGSTPIESASISPQHLAQGQKLSLFALNSSLRPVSVQTTVTDVAPMTIPINAMPRFRAINFEIARLDTQTAQEFSSGILADSEGRVQGLWLSFLGETSPSGSDNEYFMGIGIHAFLETIFRPLQQGTKPNLRGLAAEFSTLLISGARQMGLTQEWVSRIEKEESGDRRLFMVRRMPVESATSQVLKDLDVVLSIDDMVVTRLNAFDLGPSVPESLSLTILRDKQELKLSVPTVEFDGESTKRVIFWAGAVLHEPHYSVLLQSKNLPSRVYVAGAAPGSPASCYGVMATLWITKVNGKDTLTLDAFLDAVKGLPDNTYVRVKCISFDFFPCVLTLKVNSHYWPTTELVRDTTEDSGWKAIPHA